MVCSFFPMEDFHSRLTGSMLARGLDPTPENLSRACGITSRDAQMMLSLSELPAICHIAKNVATGLHVRLIWLVSRDTIPQVMGALTADDLEALAILSDLTPEERRKWLRTGRHMVQS